MKTEPTDIKVGDLVCMARAGGWGYRRENDGCIARVTSMVERKTRETKVWAITGEILNPKHSDKTDFTKVPIYFHKDGDRDGWTVRFPTEEERVKFIKEDYEDYQEIEI